MQFEVSGFICRIYLIICEGERIFDYFDNFIQTQNDQFNAGNVRLLAK